MPITERETPGRAYAGQSGTDERNQQNNMKYPNIELYDNGGESADRYTLLLLDHSERGENSFMCFGFDADPTHPQGIGMHGSAQRGEHLGKLIQVADLPEPALGYIQNYIAALIADPLETQLRTLTEENIKLLAQRELLREALTDAEFLMRKVAVNWKESGSMRDSFLRSVADARQALSQTQP